MRILICDDDKLQVDLIKSHIEEFFYKHHIDLPEIAVFYSGEELLDDTGEKDLVFLDIEMPGLNGIHIGAELTKHNKNIIIFIVTSYMEYLDDAMRFKVFRYLTKPIDKQRLFRNLADAIQVYDTNCTTVPIETKNGVYAIKTHKIIMIEAQNKKSVIYTTDGIYISLKNIDYWSDNLSKQYFYRTHKSYIVNFDYVNNFDHAIIHLFNNDYTAYLAMRKYTSFKNAYLMYLEYKN